MEIAFKILHLEDNLEDAQLVQSLLARANVSIEYFFADNEKDFLSQLENQKIDLILSDYHLPAYSGQKALLLAKTQYPHIPFVFLSGMMGEDAAIESLLNGATDYVLKNKMERLVPAIHRAINEAQKQTALQKAEEALLQSEENFRHSISESPLGINIVSEEGKTIYANKAFLDIYEFESLEEFAAIPNKKRYTPESFIQYQEIKEKRKKRQEISDYVLSIINKSGEVRHVKIARKEVLWNGSKHYQFINQDITEQKKLTAELIAAKEHAEESDRLKSAFLANISHEIRTPMNGILGFTELLKMPDISQADQERYIHIIELSGNRLLNIINDLVDISKIEAGQMNINIHETNVNQLLKDLQLFFAPEAQNRELSLSFSTGLSDEKSNIQTDHTKLTQVMSNLINNALKFTKSGSINFGYSSISSSSGIAGEFVEPIELEFYVQDTGVGISTEQTAIIFERFRQGSISLTRAYEGAGLGLSISKALVELLGGKIWVESKPGKGSIFFFKIPSRPHNVEFPKS